MVHPPIPGISVSQVARQADDDHRQKPFNPSARARVLDSHCAATAHDRGSCFNPASGIGQVLIRRYLIGERPVRSCPVTRVGTSTNRSRASRTHDLDSVFGHIPNRVHHENGRATGGHDLPYRLGQRVVRLRHNASFAAFLDTKHDGAGVAITNATDGDPHGHAQVSMRPASALDFPIAHQGKRYWEISPGNG